MQLIIRELLERMEAEDTSYLSLPVECAVDLEDALNPTVLLSGHLHFVRDGKKLLVSGTVHGQVDLECSRCLEHLTHTLHVRVEEECLLDPSLPVPPDQAEEVWTREGVWVLPLDGCIDLRELIRQHAILSLPLRPLCRPDCPGLTRADRENGEEPIDPRWAVLQEFRRRLEEGSS